MPQILNLECYICLISLELDRIISYLVLVWN